MEDTEKMLSKITLSMLMFDDIEFERGNALTPSMKRSRCQVGGREQAYKEKGNTSF